MKIFWKTLTVIVLSGSALTAQDDAEPAAAAEEKKKPKPGIDLDAAKAFKRLDEDESGAIDRKEFGKSEIAQRAREKDDQGRVDAIFDRIDKDGDGEVGMFELAESLEHRKTKMMDRQTQARYDELDKNGDGFISRKEFGDSKIAEKARENGNQDKISGIFDRIDLNESGQIGPFEFANAHSQKDRKKMPPELAKRFAKLDKNDDGAIQRREFGSTEKAEEARENDNQEKVVAKFDEMDRNGNDEIGPREFVAAHEPKAEAPPKKRGEGDEKRVVPPHLLVDFKELDRNDDKAVSKREFARGRLAERIDDRDVISDIFDRMDQNDDDEVSLKEYVDGREKMGRPGPPPRRDDGKGRGKEKDKDKGKGKGKAKR